MDDKRVEVVRDFLEGWRSNALAIETPDETRRYVLAVVGTFIRQTDSGLLGLVEHGAQLRSERR